MGDVGVDVRVGVKCNIRRNIWDDVKGSIGGENMLNMGSGPYERP